ncbi:hypothetical protein J4477_00800 [Candidatus Pacearchaeota archaeon]|nr:hypothetical protein [Candidatus Pacearchaeota archaeon]
MVKAVKTKEQSKSRTSDKQTRQRIIDGLFYSLFSDEVAQFTGVFTYSKGSIEGILEDCYGRSKIEGLLSEQESLSFSKTYAGRPSIEYKFSFDKEKGLYLGAWKGADAFNGYASCKLDNSLIQSDANLIIEYFKSFDAMTNEERVRAIMDFMVGKGYFDVSQDSTTGESMLSLTEEGEKLAEEADRILDPEEKQILYNAVRKAEEDTEFDDDIPF